jgi:hypothetical protein
MSLRPFVVVHCTGTHFRTPASVQSAIVVPTRCIAGSWIGTLPIAARRAADIGCGAFRCCSRGCARAWSCRHRLGGINLCHATAAQSAVSHRVLTARSGEDPSTRRGFFPGIYGGTDRRTPFIFHQVGGAGPRGICAVCDRRPPNRRAATARLVTNNAGVLTQGGTPTAVQCHFHVARTAPAQGS